MPKKASNGLKHAGRQSKPESDFMKAFYKVLRESPEMFEALEEYDRTGKRRKLKD